MSIDRLANCDEYVVYCTAAETDVTHYLIRCFLGNKFSYMILYYFWVVFASIAIEN